MEQKPNTVYEVRVDDPILPIIVGGIGILVGLVYFLLDSRENWPLLLIAVSAGFLLYTLAQVRALNVAFREQVRGIHKDDILSRDTDIR